MYKQQETGTYYEMGLSIGKRFKKEFSSIVGFPPKFSKKKLKLSLEFKNEVEKQSSELLEDLHGITDGSKVDYHILMVA